MHLCITDSRLHVQLCTSEPKAITHWCMCVFCIHAWLATVTVLVLTEVALAMSLHSSLLHYCFALQSPARKVLQSFNGQCLVWLCCCIAAWLALLADGW